MNIQQVQHPIHDITKVLPETNDDVLVYFRRYADSPIIGYLGYYNPAQQVWNVDDDDCDRYDGEHYRQLSNDEFYEKVLAWSKLPEITVSE